jgi:replicative DNA helicase
LKHRLNFHIPVPNDEKSETRRMEREELKELVTRIYKLPLKNDIELVRKDVMDFGQRAAARVAREKCHQYILQRDYAKAQQIYAELANLLEPEGERGRFHDDTIMERVAWRKKVKENRIPTGMRVIDRDVLGGGLAPGWVVVLLGGSNVGKTTGVVNFMYGAVTAGFDVLGISTELQRMWIDDKLDARISGIPSQDMIVREKRLVEKLKLYYAKTKARYHTHSFEPGTATVSGIREYYNELKREGFFPKLICIDTPDLLKSALRYQKRHEALEEIYTSIFAWATAEQVPIVVTSDIKQDRLNKRLIGREDAGGSYEKIKKADVVIGLGQDAELRQKDEVEEINRIWANFDKVRTGAGVGKVVLVEVKGAYSQWQAIRVLESHESKASSSISD